MSRPTLYVLARETVPRLGLRPGAVAAAVFDQPARRTIGAGALGALISAGKVRTLTLTDVLRLGADPAIDLGSLRARAFAVVTG